MVKIMKTEPDASGALAWSLADLATARDIAEDYGLTRAVVCNWAARYADFPAPLITLAVGRVYSRDQVADWLTSHPNIGTPNGRRLT